MPSESELIQPVISIEVLGNPEATGVLFDSPESWTPPVDRSAGQQHSVRASRLKQALLTSLPLVMADLAALAACLYVAALLGRMSLQLPAGFNNHLLALSVAYLFMGMRLNLFPAAGISPVFELRQQVTAVSIAYLLQLTINGAVGVITPNEILAACFAIPMSAVAMPAMRYLTRHVCASGTWWCQPVIIVGAGQSGRAIYRYFARASPRGLRPIGVVDDEPHRYWDDNGNGNGHRTHAPPFLGTSDQLPALCREHHVHTVIAVVSDRTAEETRQILRWCSGIPNLIVLSNCQLLPSLWARSCDFAGMSGVHIQDRLLRPGSLLLSRAVDIVVSALLLILSIPFFLVTAAVVKWKSPGRVFYGHRRIGRGNCRFTAWKIRTMVPNADRILDRYLEENPQAMAEWQAQQKLKHDPRIIGGVGHFLRRTSLDELPQLWNVLVGDMSLVGPRPIVDNEIEKYGEVFPLYLQVRPGITGLWQVSGRNNTSYEDRVRLDTYYVRNWSMWLDYYIILRTVRTVVLREGGY